MLDLKFIRAHEERVRRNIALRGERVDLDRLLALDEERRRLLVEGEGLKHERNVVSEEIGRRKREGKDAEDLLERMKGVAARVRELDRELSEVNRELGALLLWVPNITHETVPQVDSAEGNKIVRTWGEKPHFDFTPRPHWDLTETLGLTEFNRASALAGSGFSLFKGAGASLVRALIGFMLDLHTHEHGYLEIAPPYLANRESMEGTGQLPKLEEDMYRIEVDEFFLIPTGEVPLTNLHRGEILEAAELPLRYTTYTPCFRREAGAYGKDTRGLNRLHQFDKVELVRICRPDSSYEELEQLVGEAEEVLKRLEIPYRVSLLAAGDLGFSAAKCYDLEVWSPGQEKWLEVSSCSNFEDFQARRLGIRYRRAPGEKPVFAHTMNGSALALPRLIVALIENHQTADGRIRIPSALVPRLGDREFLS